ncbi:MAG TPA: tetratricopeptide repeat protein [Bryobacteraceae bacterium]|jgi:tetratricopeptide (TPR) repeat protein|nr:tetratricopeptide repeat protein [Bryobacteraceae bacterium]
MTKIAAALLAAGLLTTSVFAADDLEKLRDRQDRAGLTQSAAALAAAAEKTPNEADAWYKAAVAQSLLAEVAMELGDKLGSQKAAEEGAREAEKALALNSRNAEYYRIEGTLCGQIIPANPIMGALTYGRRAKEALDKAIEMDPKSSKAFIAHGVGYYYLPVNFGGGPENAMKDFRQALAIDPKSAEAYLWIGIAQRKLKKNTEAREAFNKSLQLDPGRIWTKSMLDKTPPQ